MALRGDPLREHILHIAKDVFLELGFERASMDLIASRASASKRTLYAHFENKEKLYLGVVSLTHGLLLSRLKKPGEYAADPAEAVTRFCGRFLEILLYTRTIQMCRLCITEAERFPEGSSQYFHVVFSEAHRALSEYLQKTFDFSSAGNLQAAQELLGQVIHPRFPRALFGLDELSEHLEDEPRNDFDLTSVRAAVTALLDHCDKYR